MISSSQPMTATARNSRPLARCDEVKGGVAALGYFGGQAAEQVRLRDQAVCFQPLADLGEDGPELGAGPPGWAGLSCRSKAVALAALCSPALNLARLSVKVSAMRNSMINNVVYEEVYAELRAGQSHLLVKNAWQCGFPILPGQDEAKELAA